MGLGAFVVVSELARGLLLAQGWCSAVTYFLFKGLAAAATGAAAVLVFVERVRTLKHNLEYPLAREFVLVRLGYPPDISLLDKARSSLTQELWCPSAEADSVETT